MSAAAEQERTPTEESAAAPAVLLLHGQPGGGRDWHAVRAALGDRAETIAPDRPGWNRDTAPVGVAANARAALAALDAAGVERVTIVGHSLGAAIAAWTATLAPERVRALVLVSPAANRASLAAFDRWLAVPVAGPLISGMSLTSLGLVLRLGPLRSRIADRSEIDGEYLDASGRALLTAWARRAFAAEQRALLRDLPLLEDRLGEIRVPTWIVTGQEDRIVPPRAPQALSRQIPGAQLIELRDGGHLLPQRHPNELADVILMAIQRANTG